MGRVFIPYPQEDQAAEFDWMMAWEVRLRGGARLLVEAEYEHRVEKLERVDTRSRVAFAILVESINGIDCGSAFNAMQSVPQAVDWWSYFDCDLPTLILEDADLEAPTGDPPAPDEPLSCSLDYASVNHRGKLYIPSTNQASCMKVMYEAWFRGTPVMTQAAITGPNGADLNQTELRKVFEGHEAWRTLIVPAGKGKYRLDEPSPKEKPVSGKTAG